MEINPNARVGVVEEHKCCQVGPKCFYDDLNFGTQILTVKAVEPDTVVKMGACWSMWSSLKLSRDGEALLVHSNTWCVGKLDSELRRAAEKRWAPFFNVQRRCGSLNCFCSTK
ncbi:unnamed protein product [Ostreobium quekettii]|uniref:Uncharacterized protein n=1 Tax=Ostreobium quekettii TaxID=121088 RepID=A0A8S1J7J4_9CHLO|nr:unnamed protein product [Ostreobium quekettii]|eukprot:evm.model.scf_1143.5 EVM.evm.TU.scf_1143.5   scf_1143:31776-32114(+)